MKIYRLENKEKNGIYQGFICWDEASLEEAYRNNEIKHPAPESDSKFVESYRSKGMNWLDWTPTYFFGFASPEQLLRWFYNYDDLIRMEYAGFHVSVYECDDVIVGNTQVAFNGCFHRNNAPETIYSMCEFLDTFSPTIPSAQQ